MSFEYWTRTKRKSSILRQAQGAVAHNTCTRQRVLVTTTF